MAVKLHFSPRPNRAADIKWQQWGPEAFAKAEQEAKPVLLAISAVWCHWCHVMDETSYSDPAVIDLINERFVPIRVDNDQRPDVNARYNLGGWPTTAILTPEGEILRGGTYLPPEAMRPFLAQVADLYSDPANRLEFAKRIAEMKAKRAVERVAPESRALDPLTAANLKEQLSQAFDDDYGGFGTEPKFPHIDALHFLLDLWARTPDGRAQTMVQMSLRGMAGGGMYDHVEGGFFRYSTTRDFSVPHFEKMLEDLGGLMLACARAGALFGDAALSGVAADVKRYLDERLWSDETHGYGGSQDADEVYYGLDKEGRARSAAPYVDRTVYTSWNAEAARALIVGGPLLVKSGIDAQAWVSRGLETLEMLWSRLLVDSLMARYYDGTARVRGLLVDQVWSAWAAIAAFSASGNVHWLDRARSLVDAAEILYDARASAYLDRLPGSEQGRVGEPNTPMQENALMSRVLFALSALLGEPSYAQRARVVLERFARTYKSTGIFAAGYAAAALDALEPPLEIKIAGQRDAETTRALRDSALSLAAPPLRVNVIDPSERERLASLDVTTSDGAVAYVCDQQSCFARVNEPKELVRALTR